MSSSGKPSRNRTTAIPHGNNQNVRGQPPRAPRRAQPTASHRQRQIDEEALARELRRFVLALLKRPFDEIVAEFARIGQPTSTQTAFDQNMALNRYRDVICNDRSRVSLVWPEGNTQSYIHANVIECNGNFTEKVQMNLIFIHFQAQRISSARKHHLIQRSMTFGEWFGSIGWMQSLCFASAQKRANRSRHNTGQQK